MVRDILSEGSHDRVNEVHTNRYGTFSPGWVDLSYIF